ncbi:MAG TPA: anthranilate synthase component I [Verrucomicrobia bacterium]|nr:MAG: anthranilate synthase component I [Lentisphaerae bacterium GWF2_57_35]HBA83455.1 anthranilate synthase component I [Verrucomicrobiota bacterium]
MYTPDKETFLKKARQGNLVPVWRELVADQDTPVAAYERLCNGLAANGKTPCSFLLESVEGGEHVARYSFLGGQPRTIFRATGRRVEIESQDGSRQVKEQVDPLTELKALMARFKAVPDPALPRFFGGAVGYIGYDAVAQFERIPLNRQNGLGWPDMVFMITDTLLVFDHVSHTLKVIANASIEDDPEAAYADALQRIDVLCALLSRPMPHPLIDACAPVNDVDFKSNMSRAAFMESVEKAKEYIRAGDIIQVVLSQRFEADCPSHPHDVYRALRSVNPSPYMYCLNFGGQHVVGSSPEIHVRCEDGVAEVRPIAGTRPRSTQPAEDARLAEELLADPKERAEHIMLVDLARNDLGRVCEFGSVKTPELMQIERYSHVMHIVSDVVGQPAANQDAYEVLKATFPAGTVSGAPKIRAMEIIAELETAQRGPYAGAIGYFSFTGNLDSCIAIRTALIEDGKAYVQAGAGIVADSDPGKEYEETQNKAKGMLKALAMASHYASSRQEAARS